MGFWTATAKRYTSNMKINHLFLGLLVRRSSLSASDLRAADTYTWTAAGQKIGQHKKNLQGRQRFEKVVTCLSSRSEVLVI